MRTPLGGRARSDLGAVMSPPGRPKGEYRSAQHEGCLMSPHGRPNGVFRLSPEPLVQLTSARVSDVVQA